MGLMDRLLRLFGPPAPAPEPVFEPAKLEGVDRRLKERRVAPPGIKVLIIDDSTTIVALLRRMMRQN